MKHPYSSIDEINKFLSEQNLEEHEIFNADISINTYLNSIDIKTKVIISFADTFNWVVVTFIESTLNTDLYPTVFKAKFDEMVYENDKYLLIKGCHSNNRKIGNYKIIITPNRKN
ncbi:hypothetical protein H3Z85_11530 [Chryseobacterium indologenes]|uniref:hypothetical protein n=1 Tax=Chryseobacterium indologenes TaxID=253 RepID=UPI0003E06E6A|nr:hypothetical protein [Chryseobacterium indologenes]QPQ50185.1 hypothetical protein H3Z85_11530 [Chryseobacterium indologenes]GAE66000.1 hypothetical protein CIN01S_13_00890 [Chryseobacterium indologenes NBRC 14944]SFK35181.1 hypothetical protein SAMN05421692_4137 [Chryseobacterium indologenes]SUX52779.1 Uncharacterised protein [Chryseobacterium indologenes]